jgi:DNA (cytosine-5)-methyltransferase 1
MGIDWMNRNELSEAIPPAYTEFIGMQLLESLLATDHAGDIDSDMADRGRIYG